MARRAAGVRQRENGTLEKRFTVAGRRYSVYGRTQKEITEKEQEIRDRIKRGLYTDNSRITLDGYFEEWIARKAQTVKGGTVNLYKQNYKKHISPALGRRRVSQIERREIISFLQGKRETGTPTLCNSLLIIITAMLNDAERDEIISRNPAEKIQRFRPEGEKITETRHRALTEQEQAVFMQAARGTWYYELFAFMLCTGCRLGEAGALRWGDIDTKQRVIHIRQTLTQNADGQRVIDTPKTAAGIRDIPLTQAAAEVLEAQKKKTGQIYRLDGSSLVFQSTTGGFLFSSSICREIEKIAKAAGVERFTSHAFRDTFATRYIEQGGTPQTLKTILGHSSLAMTMDLYAHVLPNTKQEEMDRLRITI